MNTAQEKVLYQNTTQVSNFILDNLPLLTEGQLRVILVVTRKTIGWHKETDFLRYSQLIELTGLSKPTLSKAVNQLVEAKILRRIDKDEKEIDKMPQGYRGEISYTLNKNLSKDELVKNFNQLKNLTSTGKNSLPYKTNSLQNSISLSKDKEQARGIKSVGDLLKSHSLNRNLPKDNRITKGFQYYAYRAADIAGLKNGGRSRLFQIFQTNKYGEFQVKKTAEVIKHPNYLRLPNESAKAAYLAGAYKKSL